MFCIFNNILICSINDLQLLNINNFNFIINCSLEYNKLFENPNYINLNIKEFNIFNIDSLFNIINFIIKNINQKIILLDENGKNNAMVIGLYLFMKYYKINFSYAYDNIKTLTELNNKNYYFFLNNIDLINKDHMEIEC